MTLPKYFTIHPLAYQGVGRGGGPPQAALLRGRRSFDYMRISDFILKIKRICAMDSGHSIFINFLLKARGNSSFLPIIINVNDNINIYKCIPVVASFNTNSIRKILPSTE